MNNWKIRNDRVHCKFFFVLIFNSVVSIKINCFFCWNENSHWMWSVINKQTRFSAKTERKKRKIEIRFIVFVEKNTFSNACKGVYGYDRSFEENVRCGIFGLPPLASTRFVFCAEQNVIVCGCFSVWNVDARSDEQRMALTLLANPKIQLVTLVWMKFFWRKIVIFFLV